MAQTAVERALALGEIWELIANQAELAELATLRKVCRRANAAAARRDFQRLLFKVDRNSYALGRIRAIESLKYVRTLKLDRLRLMNLRRLLGAMETVADEQGPQLERVDLRVWALHAMPKMVDISNTYPMLRTKLQALRVPGQAYGDYQQWNGNEAIKWWKALADFLDRRGENDLPLQVLMISPGTNGHGIFWPDQITNGPSSRFYSVLEATVAPHLETLAITIGREDDKLDATTFLRISQIAFPKLRKLWLVLRNIQFSEFQKQDFDALLYNSPEIEELYLTGCMSCPTRLRTYLPKLKHLSIEMSESDKKEHASSVRDEVIAFAQAHRSQLLTLSQPGWANIEIDASEYPLLRGVGPGILIRNRAAVRMASVDLNYRTRLLGTSSGEPIADEDVWSSRFAELVDSTDSNQVTFLSLNCTEPIRIEPGIETLMRLHKSGNFLNLQELQLNQSLGWQGRASSGDATTIWTLLKMLEPLSTLRAIWMPLGYQQQNFLSEKNLTLEGATSTITIPPSVELVVEGYTFYRVLRSTTEEGSSVRLDPINARHVPIHHSSDIRPELRLPDYCNGLSQHPMMPIPYASMMEHIDVDTPAFRAFVD
ncbi:unnamed protein product [Tilletia controversa]|nr:unnamed protein product [Tilletia controversa]